MKNICTNDQVFFFFSVSSNVDQKKKNYSAFSVKIEIAADSSFLEKVFVSHSGIFFEGHR